MTPVDQFQSAIEKLADQTASQARRIANRRNITRDDKAVRLAALLNRSNAQAVTLADAFTQRQLEQLTGKPSLASGLVPTDDSERLLKAAKTVLAEIDLDRVERLARSEPLQTAQSSATEALSGQKQGRGGYLGWTRQLNAGACALCAYWARDGRIYPVDHGFARHPNCACVPRIVITPTKPTPVRRKGTT